MERDELTLTVARNLALLIEQKGTNNAKLARDAGVNPTGVYDILSGKSRSPKLETVYKLAKALNVPVSVLVGDADELLVRDRIVDIFARLPGEEKRRLLLTAEAWLARPETG